MAFSVGLIGFPNAGKSTLFKALTKREVRIEPRPFSTVEPNVGVVPVPDERFERITKIVNPGKKTPATIEFWDIAGLVKEAHKGEGLGNQFLAQIRNCSALVEVIRCFESKNVAHVETSVDPERDLEIIKTELVMKDLQTVNNALSKIENEKSNKKNPERKAILKKIQNTLERGKSISEIKIENKELIKEYQFLTQKPIVYLLNTDDENAVFRKKVSPVLRANLQIEAEMTELSPKEKEELGLKSILPKLITSCHKVLDLITFYTIKGGEEARAWPLKKGQTVIEAADKVHSDFKENFIRAEVISGEKLIALGGWTEAKNEGQIKTAGRDYIVKDGDIIEFKI